jgi:hypothetical protein
MLGQTQAHLHTTTVSISHPRCNIQHITLFGQQKIPEETPSSFNPVVESISVEEELKKSSIQHFSLNICSCTISVIFILLFDLPLEAMVSGKIQNSLQTHNSNLYNTCLFANRLESLSGDFLKQLLNARPFQGRNFQISCSSNFLG